MKKLTAIVCVIAAMITIFIPAKGESTAMNESKYGLHVEEDGTVTLEGEPFYGFGVNYFGAFARYVESPGQSTKEFTDGLAGLASYNIPFIRIPLCSYYPSYYELYDSDPEKVFSYLKLVLDECEKNNIGVIGSLMWWDAVIAAHLGAKRSDMGVIGSEVLEYAKKYTRDVVSRFADHPAIWGWEIGNEYNLDADLCDPELKMFLWPDGISGMPLDGVNGYDYLTSDELVVFYKEIAGVIREYDTYRLITTGNGEMRPSAYAMRRASRGKNKDHVWTVQWNANTRKQFEEMNEFYTPDPIDTLCFHLQNGSYDGSNKYVMSFSLFGETIDNEEYFRAYYETAKKLGKACFFGEFGDMLEMETAPDVIEKFREVTDAISGSGIQIAALWQFQDYTDAGVAGEKLAVLSELNLKLKADGKQKTASAWQEETAPETTAEPDTTTVTESVTNMLDGDGYTAEKKYGAIPYIAAAAAVLIAAAVTVIIVKKKRKK